MNLKLEDLMYMSGMTAQGCWDSMDDYQRQAVEKFAQMIVKECADVGYDSSYYECALHVSNMIKQHFGVEE
jgi:hypothetical protein